MRAVVLDRRRDPALALVERPMPTPGPGQVLLRVLACALCRTDLHVIDGDLPHPKPDLVLGHQIVGEVVAHGPGTASPPPGARVGVTWLGGTCGVCDACRSDRENLCPDAKFTGYDLDGGLAEYTVARAAFCLPVPEALDSVAATPLLCAGAIGWRALRLLGPARRLGIYGFGAAAHLLIQAARERRVFAFTRPGDAPRQDLARSLGAAWAGGSDTPPPEPLDGAILFAPAGELVPTALAATVPGGCVVCAEIHMSDIPSFPYALLWGERTLRSVANLTRRDGAEILALAPRAPITTETTVFPLEAVSDAIQAVRAGRVRGSAVIVN